MLSHKPLFHIAFYCYVFTPKKITNNITLPLKIITLLDSTKNTQTVKAKLAPIHFPYCYVPFSHAKTKALVFRTTICYTGYIR